MIEDFLGKLGASTRITIGVAISPNVGLEMIEVDRTTGTVSKYANRPLAYNHSTREITDYNEFRSALEELFDELHIPRKSNIILSLPNVHFGMISLPLLLMDDAITNVIISEVEQSYIFKRHEPVVSWSEITSNIDTENRTLAYTAIQKSALTEISNVCNEIGCKLVGVEDSYTSLLRALHYSTLAQDQMQDGITWNLMIIGQNSYSIISMSGKKIIEYYEEPLALKSFVDDEIYNAITSSAQLTLAGLPANHLFIVSETDLVSAEVLSMKMPIESSIKFLECNKYTQNEIIPVNLNVLLKTAMQITLAAIGVAVLPFCDFPLKLNLISEQEEGFAPDESESPRINVGGLEIELTPDFIKRISSIVAGVVLLPMFIIFLLLKQAIIPSQQAKLDALNSQITEKNQAISKYSTGGSDTFSIEAVSERLVSQNANKLSYYGALGLTVPNNLWITYFMSNSSNKIDIKGKSTSVEGVYTFYKNLKQTVNNSDVRLYKLEIASSSIDDVVESVSSVSKTYDFEITNMTAEELNPPAAGAAAAPGTATPAAPAAGTPAPTTAPNGQTPQPGNIFSGNGSAPPAPTGNKPPAANLEKIENF